MVNEFALPDVGEGLTEAELVTWRVAAGDTVAVNDIICEIETAKSIVELPTPYAGIVSEILVPVGATVPVGTPLIRVGAADEVVSASAAEPPDEPATTAPPADLPNVRTIAETSERSDDPTQPLTLVGSGPKDVRASRHVLAKPGARLAAREAGIDLSTVAAVRPDGVLTTADVAAPSVVQSAPRITQLQRAMAGAMVASAAVPRVTIWTTVDATRTVELADRLSSRLMAVVARMTVMTLKRHPLLNSTFTDDGVTLHDRVNLGIAAATPRGLIVPNIREADRLDLVGLQAALDDLIAVARSGRTQPEAQVGGTFTITNIGPFGIEGGTPLLNPGESGILCLGAVGKRPWVVGEAVIPRDVVTLSLTFDHRHIDGEAGSRFLRDLARLIEDPGTAVTF